MAAKLIVAVVVMLFDRRILNGAVHSFDLTIGPWRVRCGQPVFNLICRADHVEAHGPRIDCVPVAGLVCKLDAPSRPHPLDAPAGQRMWK